MKLLSILVISIVLTGCTMSLEEYNDRVKYCQDHGLKAEVSLNKYGNVLSVSCKTQDGILFNSKEK